MTNKPRKETKMEKLTHNAPTKQSNVPSTQNEPSTHQTIRKHRFSTIAALVRQSFDTFNLYGRQPESLENQTRSFSFVLKDFTDNEITSAFAEWLTKETMPVPANILALCEFARKAPTIDGETVKARDAAKAREEQRKRDLLNQSPLSDKEFDEMMENVRDQLKPERKKLTSGKIDTSHFDRMSQAAQDHVKNELAKSVQRMRGDMACN